MRYFVIFLVLVGCAGPHTVIDVAEERAVGQGLVYPLYSGGQFVCSAFQVDTGYWVTAGHCVQDDLLINNLFTLDIFAHVFDDDNTDWAIGTSEFDAGHQFCVADVVRFETWCAFGFDQDSGYRQSCGGSVGHFVPVHTFTAEVNFGMSGGPVVDSRGCAIGITTRKGTQGTTFTAMYPLEKVPTLLDIENVQ